MNAHPGTSQFVCRRKVSVATAASSLAGLILVQAINLGAQTAWLSPVSGGWSTASNWSAGVPVAGVNATIDTTGAPYLVSQNAGTITANTLSLNSADATLALTGNALLNLSTSAGSTFAAGALNLTGSRLVGQVTFENGFQVLNTSGSSQINFSLNRGLIRSTNGTLNLRSRISSTTFVNDPGGRIIADGGNAFVGLGALGFQEWKNAGELIATNGGRLTLGDCAVTNLGVIRVSDTARVGLVGIIDNTGFTLLGPLGGAFDAEFGSVRGGRIAPGAIVLRSRLNSGGVGLRLLGAIWEGDVVIAGDNSLRLENGSEFTGTNFTASGAFGLTVAQTCTLAGKSIVLNGLPSTPTPFRVGGNVSHVVTLAPDTVLRGTNFQFVSEIVPITQIVNHGLIQHEGGNSTTSGLGILRNEGVIRVLTNTFSLRPASLTNNGVLEVRAGATLVLADLTFDQSATGELRGNGLIALNTPIPGGILRPGDNGPGKLTVQPPFGQPATFTGPTTFAMEIGGGTNDQVSFNSGSVLLSNGIVTLNLTLTAVPTAQTYRLLQLPNGAPQLTGTFVGLPDLSTISAPFGGSNYTFIVDYDTKGLSLRDPVAVPLVTGPPPALSIQNSGSNSVLIQWPSPSTGFDLQQNPDLTTTNWTLTPAPTDDGTNKFIIINPPIGNRFYRLFKP